MFLVPTSEFTRFFENLLNLSEAGLKVPETLHWVHPSSATARSTLTLNPSP